MRIVGGQQRGRRISVPSGRAVRPTTERVREALFNLLSRLVSGRPAYDLFAGSGALGLESLSRGAASATFVERDPRVASVLRRNIRDLGFEDRATVTVANVYRWAEGRDRWPTEPALVLIAPPYAHFAKCIGELTRLWETLVHEMPGDTAIAIQAPPRFDRASLPPGQDWELRRYGDTQLIVCQTEPESSGEFIRKREGD